LKLTDKLTGTPSLKTICVITLWIVAAAGISCKFLQSINLDLDSDSVYPGLVSMEFWKHGNHLLSGFYLNSADNHLLSEIFTFQFLPQVLSNYDPAMLRVMSFVIFALIVAVYSYLVYRLTSDTMKTAAFAALLSTIGPLAYWYYAVPTMHQTVILATGVFLLLLWDLEKTKGYIVAIVLILVAMMSYSDSMILAYFVIPYSIAYLFLFRPKTRRSNIIVGSFLVVAGFVTVYKNLFMSSSVPYVVKPAGLGTGILGNAVAWADSMAQLLNAGLYSAITTGAGPAGYLAAIAFLAAMGIATWNAVKEKSERTRLVYAMFAIIAVVMTAACLFTSLNTGLPVARYLTFLAIAVLVMLALSFRMDDKLYVVLVATLLVFGLALNLVDVYGLDYRPNTQEFATIDFLSAHNLTYGYGDYWDASIYTYLSQENVTILPVLFTNDSITPYKWLTCERWYQSRPDSYFVIVRSGSANAKYMDEYMKSRPSENQLVQGDYEIYEFNDSSIYDDWQFEHTSGLQKLLGYVKKFG
jgi:hypothetical protein